MKKLFWLGYITALLISLIGMAKCTHAHATPPKVIKMDTCHVNTESITAFYVKTSVKTGKDSYFMIYQDADQNIDDLIPLANSVYEYCMTCNAMKIAPHLGIVFKNNTPSRVIKYRKMGYRPKKFSGHVTIYKKKTS